MSQPVSNHPYPVLFIHGLWIHASAWQPWQELFEAEGYSTAAPGWPGDGPTVQATRDDPSPLDGVGIEAICRHYADLIDAMPVKPIVVGHSFGGAAVIAAARDIPEADAVATVGAPYDPSHVERQYDAVVERVLAHGEAPVQFGDKALTMKRAFVEDVRQADLRDAMTAAASRAPGD